MYYSLSVMFYAATQAINVDVGVPVLHSLGAGKMGHREAAGICPPNRPDPVFTCSHRLFLPIRSAALRLASLFRIFPWLIRASRAPPDTRADHKPNVSHGACESGISVKSRKRLHVVYPPDPRPPTVFRRSKAPRMRRGLWTGETGLDVVG